LFSRENEIQHAEGEKLCQLTVDVTQIMRLSTQSIISSN